MAERWQQWMPHQIDAWQGSANVQALSDLAYRAVHNLLQDMWKQEDCALPDDDRELAKRSRVGRNDRGESRWPECKSEVLDYFDRTDDGKITHRVLLCKWNEAREVYEKRQRAAQRTNASRSGHGDRDGDRDAQPTHVQEQVQVQEQKQKPSRAKREGKEPDARHEPVRAEIERYMTAKGCLFVWDGSEAAALALLLKATPTLTLETFQQCLLHRARSPGVPHGERPRLWLPNVLKYQQGPLNEFGKVDERPGSAEATLGMIPQQPQMTEDEIERTRAWIAEKRAGNRGAHSA